MVKNEKKMQVMQKGYKGIAVVALQLKLAHHRYLINITNKGKRLAFIIIS